jgi:hypothetical protein
MVRIMKRTGLSKATRLLFLVCGAILAITVSVPAQTPQAEPERPSPAATQPKPAPNSVNVRYEGGMLGYSSRESGTIEFDDINERLVFFGKDKKEKFSLPYASLLVVQPHSRSVTSTTGNVVRNIPLPGAGLGGFIREKRRYLILQFADPVVDTRGTVSFRLDNREMLDRVIEAIGEKAGLTQRGDAYYRPRPNPREI